MQGDYPREIEVSNSMKRDFIYSLVLVPPRNHIDGYMDSVEQPLHMGTAHVLAVCVA